MADVLREKSERVVAFATVAGGGGGAGLVEDGGSTRRGRRLLTGGSSNSGTSRRAAGGGDAPSFGDAVVGEDYSGRIFFKYRENLNLLPEKDSSTGNMKNRNMNRVISAAGIMQSEMSIGKLLLGDSFDKTAASTDVNLSLAGLHGGLGVSGYYHGGSRRGLLATKPHQPTRGSLISQQRITRKNTHAHHE